MTPTQALTLAREALHLFWKKGKQGGLLPADCLSIVDVHSIQQTIRAIDAALSAAPAGEPVAPRKEALTELIADALHGTYHCGRVWQAWHIGTMSKDDFSPVDQSETPAEIADAVLAAFAAPAPAEPAPEGWQHAGHVYNLVAHALMDADAPHGGCKHRLRLILEELAPLPAAPASPKG